MKVGNTFQLLNCDEHEGILKKHDRLPGSVRPDITHQCLMMLLDSPLNRAGLLQVRSLVQSCKSTYTNYFINIVLFKISENIFQDEDCTHLKVIYSTQTKLNEITKEDYTPDFILRRLMELFILVLELVPHVNV